MHPVPICNPTLTTLWLLSFDPTALCQSCRMRPSCRENTEDAWRSRKLTTLRFSLARYSPKGSLTPAAHELGVVRSSSNEHFLFPRCLRCILRVWIFHNTIIRRFIALFPQYHIIFHNVDARFSCSLAIISSIVIARRSNSSRPRFMAAG